MRTAEWKHVLTDSNDEALFKEEVDPYEMDNVAGATANASVLEAMRGYMRKWMAQVGDIHAPPPDVS